MEERCMYVIGVGDQEDWEAYRGSLYYIEDKYRLRALPVFTSGDRAGEYVRTILDTPEAHMGMMEGAPVTHVESLTAGRFTIMPVEWPEGMAEVAANNDMDYLVRDPRASRGARQEIVPLSDRAKAR